MYEQNPLALEKARTIKRECVTPKRLSEIQDNFYSTGTLYDFEIHEMLEEIDRLRNDLSCNNVNCRSSVKHSNVWCDYVMQESLSELREKLEVSGLCLNYTKTDIENWKHDDIITDQDILLKVFDDRIKKINEALAKLRGEK